MKTANKCQDCGGSGWMSDQGPGRPRGAHEYVECDCKPRNPIAIDWQARAEKAEADLASINALFADIKTVHPPKFDKRKRRRK